MPPSGDLAAAFALAGGLGAPEPEAQPALETECVVRRVPRGQELRQDVVAGFIARGYGARYIAHGGGRAAVAGLLIPGDSFGLGRARPLDQCSLISLTPLEAVALDDPMSLDAAWPGLAAALQAARVLEESRLLRQIARLAWRSAEARLCDLFLELKDRSFRADLNQAGAFPMPLTQSQLGEVTCLSIVHVNRVLQQLRAHRLLMLRDGWMTLLDTDSMVARAELATSNE